MIYFKKPQSSFLPSKVRDRVVVVVILQQTYRFMYILTKIHNTYFLRGSY